ncbi:MAG: tRNA threonylcarbamoyladenosine dehydratase [Bacilli bacterium]|nr:tRNA threonylcarbamoyladenosine dehydratase [Bacilli bacterium]
MFDREELLIGKEKLELLKTKHVLILGVGGVGGYVVESLARSGINQLTIIDYDKVDITNINRQIIALHSNIGKKKVDCFKERILDINPDCVVTALDLFYNAENKDLIFKDKVDFIIDCCDSLNSKKIIIEEAINRNIPIISSMGAGNKLHPELFKIEKLKKTAYDPLAKKLRYLLKDNKEALNIPVAYSEERGIVKITDKIPSIAFVPSAVGLLISSYVIINLIKGE